MSKLKKEKRATAAAKAKKKENERETLDFGALLIAVKEGKDREGEREEDVADFEEGPTNSAYGQASKTRRRYCCSLSGGIAIAFCGALIW